MSDKLVEARRLLKESYVYTDRAMRISYIQDTIGKILEYLEEMEAEGSLILDVELTDLPDEDYPDKEEG